MNKASWVAGAVLLAAVLIATAHLSANSLEFSRSNADWNGTSTFFAGLDRHQTVMVTDPAQLSPYRSNAILLIIAPSRPPSGPELAAYRAFLEQGNTLFLADDFGSGNSILKGLGSRISIREGNLSSIDQEYADPYSVVVYRRTGEGIAGNSTMLVLNRPAALAGGNPLFSSSIFSWIDKNGDKRINPGEVLGQFPVMTEEQVGRGRLVVFSDPSIFINSMLRDDQPGDNLRFIRDLTHGNATVLADQMNSRTRDAEGLGEILQVIKTTFIIEVLISGLLVLAVAWMWRRKVF
jgi:hypothetical protein